MSRFTCWIDPEARSSPIFLCALAVILAAFLLGVGLGPDSLPFPPESDYSDVVTSHWPNALFLRRAVLDDHTWPLWRPLIMSGQPFAANPLNKVWYPPQWLVFILPPALHLNVLTWLHLLVAGAGAWTWSRATGLSGWAAGLAGFGYAFAPRLIASVGAGHLDLVYAAAWFPWLLWAVYRAVQPAPTHRSALWLALFAALCFLADVRLSAYTFVTAAVYALWLWFQARDLEPRPAIRRIGPGLLLAALLAAGLTAVQWVPLLQMRADLSRSTITLDDVAAHSLAWGQWIGLLIGDHGGAWDTMVYVGISTLVLAVTALLLRPRALAFWGALVLIAGLYALGDQFILWPLLARLIPPIRWWRVPPRAWFVAALILPYLAGWGAQLLAGHPSKRQIARLGVVALLGGGLVCGLSSLIMLSPHLELTAILGIFALPAVALVMLLAIFGKLAPRALLILFALVVAVDVLWMDRTLIDGRDKNTWLEPYRELADYLDQVGAVRVYSPDYRLPQQAAAYWNIQQFDGVDPFQLRAYVDAAEAATGVKADGYSVTIPAYDNVEENDLASANRDAPISPALLGQWLVTHVLSAYEIEADGLELDTIINDVYIYRNACAPDITLDWDGPNRVTITAASTYTGSLYAVAAGRWHDHSGGSPGLPGTADGTRQTWTLRYDPSSIWTGLLIGSILVALASAGWWITSRA
ncbi:MAG: hypothetical protein JXJ20_07040 [Anaerolineae bacterium]|nr:hypothetical protein [Anaerolineae bacterium]